MSQIILTGVGDPAANLRLESDLDLKVGVEDVLLRMEAAPVNPVEFLYSNGWYGVPPRAGEPIGAEGVGRVVEAGSAAGQSLTGRRVVVLGTYEQGVWGDTVVVPARNVVAVPEGIDGLQLAMSVINPVTRDEIERVVGEVVDLVGRGVLTVPVDSTFPFERFQEALARHVSPERAGKVLLTFGD